MVGGREAAKTSATCIKKNDFSNDALSQYEKSWTNIIGSDLKWGLYLQRKFTESGSKSMGSGFLRSKETARIIAEMLVGKRSVRNAILKAAPSYIKSKFV
jgi:flavin-dependent dehydrogenase